MRTITLSNRDDLIVRSLTRAEVKRLAAHGFGHAGFNFKRNDDGSVNREAYEEMFDAVIETQLTPKQADGMAESDLRDIFWGILAETYGSDEEEKNLSASGLIAQTQETISGAENAESGTEN